MKNLGYFLVVIVTAFACSSDDGGTPPPQPVDFLAAINSGGPDISLSGTDWVADKDNNASNTFSSADPDLEIAGTDDDELYRTEINDPNAFTYEIAVPAEGPWKVDLHFAEIFFGVGANTAGEGARVFDVDIENGAATLVDYDIIMKAGAPATAIVESFSGIMVTDGNLTITFTATTDRPKVSAVEVSGSYIP
ncbi:MAG: hypothetical protein DHS20C17_03210 [Cyclobacteriaceae bacterium]|nr:MAG: hypothetical protein DHS20C17_03210 [Cyclobacteriaceae bacterium]